MRDLNPGIEEYISRLEPWQQQVFFEVREIILYLHPMMEEHFLYRTPFYKFRGLFCYFTVLKKGNKTVLGICDGHLVTDTAGILSAADNQKYIRHIVFQPDRLPDMQSVLEVLNEALWLKIGKK